MPGISLQFEVKLLLVFGMVLLGVLYFGSANLSFAEAKAQADEDKSSLSPSKLSKLESYQARFIEMAFPSCLESTGVVADNFVLVIEVGANGQVARSWRQGDSEFVICFQKLVSDNYFFISIEQPFFTSFENNNAS